MEWPDGGGSPLGLALRKGGDTAYAPVAWGPDAETAVENAIALEVVAESSFRTEALQPGAAPIQPELLDRHFLRKHGPGAYYGQRS